MLKQRKTETATIWTLSPGKRVATVSAELEDDRWIVYCGNVRISDEMRHRHNADKLAHETAYFEETGRNYDYDHREEYRDENAGGNLKHTQHRAAKAAG